MKVDCTEMFVPKKTIYGTVQRSLNQHKVWVFNDDTGRMVHCGYVGVSAFLPLSGFPKELLEDVTRECEEILGRKLTAEQPPPSQSQIDLMMSMANGNSEDEYDA